jgi:hypothetical protein
MNSIERKGDRECVVGPSGEAGSEVRIDRQFIRGGKAEECTVQLAGEVRVAG